MAKYIFELSGENFELAIQELIALFETKKAKLKVLKQFNNFVLVESALSENIVSKLMERSSLVWKAAVLIRELKSLFLGELEKVKWSFVKLPFCVRVDDLAGYARFKMEAKLAGPIYDYHAHHDGKTEVLVNLEKPKTTVLFILTNKVNYVTKLLWKSEKGRFLQREPIKKPVFHPTSLKPRLARLLINLSRVQKGKTLLDPFCGTGSVLIEAAILGTNPVGMDIDAKMVSGSKTNLKFYRQKAKLIQGNALELQKSFKLDSIDAIATDPPYGRSTFVGAKSLKALYKGFFSSAYIVLKPKRYLSLLYPHYINAKKMFNKRHWKMIFETEMYVHGGLTRKFLVLQKK
jgi:tRNA (guanine10-N2)-dimethyltransferase